MATSSIAIEIAGTLQAASINRHPSPRHDLNPSTAASKKEPVTIESTDDISDVDDDEIPASVLRPVPRRATLPPLPDLRFEQSYLRSIEKAQSWGAISWITFRDQVILPLAQGTVWELALCGWRFWGQSTQIAGNSVGSRIRRAGTNARQWLIANGYVRK